MYSVTAQAAWLELWEHGAPLAQGNGDEDRPALLPFLLERPDGEPTGCIVVCPGGGYGMRANHEGEPIARWLNSIGLSAVVLRYRVSPYRHPCPLLDAQRAIRYVRATAADWKIDPERVGILGFSAGGHLASSASVHFDEGDPEAEDAIDRQSCRPDAQILCYPVISYSAGHTGSFFNLLGQEPDEALLEQLSSDRQVKANTPPAYIWHTADDEIVPLDNVLLMSKGLRAKGIPHELHVFESGKHGLGLAERQPDVAEWTKLCERWLIRLGMIR